jgi:hypothetical protein
MRRLALFLILAACSSSKDEEPFADPDLPVVAQNPDGEAYPTDHLGGNERRGPTLPGDRIPNFTFKGYRNGRASGLTNISMSEFYDPQQKRNKVLHLQLAATWCSICSSELEATVTVSDPLKERGVLFFEIVVSGAKAGAGPSLLEVDDWIDRHRTNFPTGIDVGARRLSAVGVSGTAMPHDILIDTRTMEILDSSVGAPRDVGIYVQDGLDWVATHPPSY